MRCDDEGREVDAMRRAHREASDRLDERPDAGVRATVLAAAARAVDARPHLASEENARPKPRAPARSRRWPWSAAALMVVSVVTGLVATQVMRDRPERLTTVASSARAPQISKADVPGAAGETTSEAASPAAAQAPAQVQRPAPVVESPQPKARVREPQSRERSIPRSFGSTPVKPARLPDEHRARSRAPATSGFLEPPPAPAPAADASRDVEAPAAPSAARADPRADAPSPDRSGATSAKGSSAAEAERLLRDTTAANAVRTRIGRVVEPATPEAWAERIVKLRADGNHAEADRELDALRQRYPGFEIPADALRTSGTR